MSPFYITQGDLALTDVYIPTQSVYTDTSSVTGFSNLYKTTTFANNNYHHQTNKKEETVKERHIREGGAFKCFYGRGSYTPINKNRISKAERKEKTERVNKFKGLNENLIIK